MTENKTPCTVEHLRHVMVSVTPNRPFITTEMRLRIPAIQRAEKVNVMELLDELYNMPDCEKPGADEVYPGIFVGDSFSARDLEFLKSHGINSVLNLAQGTGLDQVDTTEDYYRDAGIKFMGVPLKDDIHTDIMSHLDPSIKFIDEALNGSGKILIHCRVGVSRSPVFAMAYLMTRKHLSAEEALRTVRQNRDIMPNVGFLAQLCDLDAKLMNSKF